MKKLNALQMTIIDLLGDGLCHSGNDLGAKLNVSRTAIWKQINQLTALGIPIQRIPQMGYTLNNPLTLLNEQAIREKINHDGFTQDVHIHTFASLNSTNQFLKELPKRAGIEVCCAETQTQGRGRFGRQWYSPFGENIYFSSRWIFNCDLSHLSGLSLVVSLAVIAALKQYGLAQDLVVKWPNDILWQQKKLCGNLIEVVAESNGNSFVIIGIGLNVNSVTNQQPFPNKPWCSLRDIAQRDFDRNGIIACIINQLNLYLDKLMQHRFSAFLHEWELVDFLRTKMVTVSHHSDSLKGIAGGVNPMGELILIDEHQKEHHLSSGDTSLSDIE